jgi:hypothetical protein
MNNFAGCIEGTTNRTVPAAHDAHGCVSDLKSRNSERFDACLHGAGINDEENAGQRSKRGAPYGVSCGREVSKAYPPARSYNPCPTGAVTMATRALKSGCIPVPSKSFLEAGRPACKCEGFKGWGANEVAPPRLQSLL